jgi:hypothetical protein
MTGGEDMHGPRARTGHAQEPGQLKCEAIDVTAGKPAVRAAAFPAVMGDHCRKSGKARANYASRASQARSIAAAS